MPINNFKMNIISSKLSFIIALLAISVGISAQEKKQKVDGVIAVVGEYVILGPAPPDGENALFRCR